MNEFEDSNVGIRFIHHFSAHHTFGGIAVALGKLSVRNRIKRSAMRAKELLTFRDWSH
jgi:hypothetical protein